MCKIVDEEARNKIAGRLKNQEVSQEFGEGIYIGTRKEIGRLISQIPNDLEVHWGTNYATHETIVFRIKKDAGKNSAKEKKPVYEVYLPDRYLPPKEEKEE